MGTASPPCEQCSQEACDGQWTETRREPPVPGARAPGPGAQVQEQV